MLFVPAKCIHELKDLVSLTLSKFHESGPHVTHSRYLLCTCGTTERSEAAFSEEVKVELNSGPKMKISHGLHDYKGFFELA